MFKLCYYIICCLLGNTLANAGTIMLPGDDLLEGVLRNLSDNCVHPLMRFNGAGLLECDNGLIYSIDESVLENYKRKKSLSAIEFMCVLSDDHWIALNKKEYGYAEKISKEMMAILFGKYQLSRFSTIRKGLYNKLISNKFKWIEQIQISLGDVQQNVFEFNKEAKVDSDLIMYADLARYLTLTPLLFQMCSYDMLNVMENNQVSDIKFITLLKDIKPRLFNRNSIGFLILEKLATKYSCSIDFISLVFTIRKATYKRYLGSILLIMQNTNIRNYKCIDMGQNSGGHCNTCMFNSSFCNEYIKKNITAPKQGCLDKAQDYSTKSINVMKLIIPYEKYKDDLVFEKISMNVSRSRNDCGAEALYAFNCEILPFSSYADKKIFPGIFSEISVVEAGKTMCMSNIALFGKGKVFPEYGDTLAGYYGCGYFSNEYFPITAVSYSSSHAQSLVKI